MFQCNYSLFLGDAVTLVVPNGLFVVAEPDSDNNASVTICFESQIARPLFSEAVFHFMESSSTTATSGVDFFVSSLPYIIIPRGFSGNFSFCTEVVILGDDMIEQNEFVVLEVGRMESTDDVVIRYPENATMIVVEIIDTDGKYMGVPRHVVQN